MTKYIRLPIRYRGNELRHRVGGLFIYTVLASIALLILFWVAANVYQRSVGVTICTGVLASCIFFVRQFTGIRLTGTLNLITTSEPIQSTVVQEVVVGAINNDLINSLKNKYEKDGNLVDSWTVSHASPYTEGRHAATSGESAESVHYKNTSWKFHAWFKGWLSVKEPR